MGQIMRISAASGVANKRPLDVLFMHAAEGDCQPERSADGGGLVGKGEMQQSNFSGLHHCMPLRAMAFCPGELEERKVRQGRLEISNSDSCSTTPAGASGTEGQRKTESKRERESETQWRLCDSNGPLVKSGEGEQKKKKAGIHWWCKKKVSEWWTCFGRFKMHLEDTKVVS